MMIFPQTQLSAFEDSAAFAAFTVAGATRTDPQPTENDE